jgi:hypothetical protein
MTRIELIKPYRELLRTNYQLRTDIGRDMGGKHERTIQVWAINNSPKLTTSLFLRLFKKHSGAKEPLTEEIKISQHLE